MRILLAAAALAAGAAVVDAARNITVTNNATAVSYTGGDWKPFDNCGGTQYTYTTGQFFSTSFVGTAVYLIGTASLSGGVIGIQLDSFATTYDRYAPLPYRCGVQWFARDGLDNTTHTLTVTMQGNSPANSTTDGYLEWQWLVYTQLDASDLAAASSSSVASISSASVAQLTSGTGTSSGVPTQTGEPAKKSSNGAAIGGGIAAAVIVVILAGFLFWYCRRKKSTDNTYPNARPDLGGDGAPFPAYGQGYEQGRRSQGGSPTMAQTQGGNPMTMGIVGATPWVPDASDRASLGPASASPNGPQSANPFSPASSSGVLYPPRDAASPMTNSTTPLLSNNQRGSMSDPYPSSLNPTSNTHAPTVSGAASRDGSGSGGMPESDVDRIAQRVAAMMVQNQTQPVAPQPDYDAPPPMYNEKH